MKKHRLVLLALVLLFSTIMMADNLFAADPKGAKALFFSGEGTTVARTPSAPARQAVQAEPRAQAPSPVKYMGVSYWIERLDRNGEMRRVNSSTVFRKGDRIRVSLKSNREGYLYVINLGSTGRSTMLFPNASTPDGSNLINANQTYDIPPNTFFRFDENPGEETLLVMLSPTPMDGGMPGMRPQPQASASANMPPPSSMQQMQPPTAMQQQMQPPAQTAGYPPSQMPQYPNQPQSAAGMPQPSSDGLPPAPNLDGLPPILPPSDLAEGQGGQMGGPMDGQPQMMASAQGSKGMPRGAKDLMIDDLTVKAKTRSVGQKDLVVEEDSGPRGAYYAVAPVSTLEQGGRLISLSIKLKHR